MPTKILPEELAGPVTRAMREDFPRLLLNQTIGEAIEWIRKNPPRGPIIYFYVTDTDCHLCGVIPTRHLLLEPCEKSLSELLIRSVITIPANATTLEAYESLLKHKLMALPIVDERGRMMGVVDVSFYRNEASRIIEPGVRDDLFQTIGVYVSQAKAKSALSDFRSRFPWLSCNLFAGIVAAFLSSIYRSELSRAVSLAFFIPVALNLAESVSSQSVSLTLELLHAHIPTWKSMLRKLKHEAGTGLLLGAGSGLAVGLVALFWLGQGKVAVCLIGGITGGVTGSALIGLAVPYLLRLLRLEPRVAAGPIALAGADIITLLIYLNLARWLLG